MRKDSHLTLFALLALRRLRPRYCRMASVAAMAPQQSFLPGPNPPQASPPQAASQPLHGLPSTHASAAHKVSFEGSQLSRQQSQSQPMPTYSQSFPSAPVSNSGYARSFGEGYGPMPAFGDEPQIYTVGSVTADVICAEADRMLL